MEKESAQNEIIVNIDGAVLTTERLILRQWQESDLGDLFEYASVKGVGEPAGWKPHESIEESKKILDAFIKGKETFAVVLKESGKVIGSVGVHESGWVKRDADYSNLRLKEIGYALSKAHWGQGLMPEAVKALIEYCFDTYPFDALSCCYCGQNVQSQRVIEKCGFTFLKIGKYFSDLLQRELDDNIYIMMRPSR